MGLSHCTVLGADHDYLLFGGILGTWDSAHYTRCGGHIHHCLTSTCFLLKQFTLLNFNITKISMSLFKDKYFFHNRENTRLEAGMEECGLHCRSQHNVNPWLTFLATRGLGGREAPAIGTCSFLGCKLWWLHIFVKLLITKWSQNGWWLLFIANQGLFWMVPLGITVIQFVCNPNHCFVILYYIFCNILQLINLLLHKCNYTVPWSPQSTLNSLCTFYSIELHKA